MAALWPHLPWLTCRGHAYRGYMAPPSPNQVQLKRLAAHISREVREQWVQVERVAQYKHDQRLEAARKESREKQLDFLVGQTARYTDMLTEGMQGAAAQPAEEHRHVNTAERVDRQAELAALQAEAEAPLDEAALKLLEVVLPPASCSCFSSLVRSCISCCSVHNRKK